ncbi:MAG: hypothetical protein HGA45_06305 [Chloroflexales bacterium]|nr:hypothetical protein [Chloroflexales bacterium]
MTAASSQTLLVPTKLTAPQPHAWWVRRERLLAQLAPALPTRLTLVIAPAGFGKSTLVTQWLSERMKIEGRRMKPGSAPDAGPSSFAWLTLDEHDQDGLRFLAYLAGAIERVSPQALPTTRPLLTAPEPPPLYLLLQALLVDLSALPSGLTLVLDDYHTITAEAVQQAVAYLLRHLPPTCHLVLLSRADPPLPLARLRAEQQLTELRAADLRFTAEEAGALLTNLLDRAPAPSLVSSLHAETEGWAIALQLAALAQRAPASNAPPQGQAQYQLAEYLADEVLDRQPAPLQAALLALAVPERVCAGLAAALLDPPDDLLGAEERLSALVRANLLLPLDVEGRWYRFHHLFRELLLRRLRLAVGPAAVEALQLRAARWLEAADLVKEAVRLYLAAGAEDAAADLVERLLLSRLGRDRSSTPGAWLRLLPADLVARRPGLTLLEARRAANIFDLAALAEHLRRLDMLLAAQGESEWMPPWSSFTADAQALQGILHCWQGRLVEAVPALQAALAQGPVARLALQALVLLGQALAALGRYDDAVRMIDAFGTRSPSRPGGMAFTSFCLCGVHIHAGALNAVTREAWRLREMATAPDLDPLWTGYAEAFLAVVAYERSDLAVAAAHYSAVVERKDQVHGPTYLGSLVGLALIAAAEGDFAVASDYEQEVWAYAAEVGGSFLRHQALGLATRLALARGEITSALRMAEEIGPDIHLGMSYGITIPQLSKARALIAGGDIAALTQADAVVAACLAEIAPLHNVPLLVQTLVTQALLRQAQGRPDEALAALDQARHAAEPGGHIRAFLDGGPALAPLLRTLAAQRPGEAFVQHLLAWEQAPAPAVVPMPAIRGPRMPELLTRREDEILTLLAERWSDKEIAEQLVITPNTVRRHTSTIYGKLGVGSRREAVEVARALGLLPDA